MSEIDEFKASITKFATENGFSINQNFDWAKFIDMKTKYGDYYCPCRAIGAMAKSKWSQFKCPCIMHKADIEKKGSCFCKLMSKQ